MFSKISTFTVSVAATLAAQVVPAAAQITKPSAGPATTLPTATVAPHNLLLPPPTVTAPPPGISVTLQNCVGAPAVTADAPFSLGMASTFNINTTAQSGPATGVWAGGQVGTGSVQFTDGNTLAMWLANCQTAGNHILPRMTITNVSSSGTVVYDMPSVLLTGQQFGSAVSYSFDFTSVTWTVASPGGTLLSRNSCQYMQTPRGCR